MYLALLMILGGLTVLGAIRKPLISLLAVILATQFEYFFMGKLPMGMTLGRIAGAIAFSTWILNREHTRTVYNLVRNRVFFPIFMLIGVTLVGAIFAHNPGAAITEVIKLCILFMLCLMVVDMIRSPNDLRAVLITLSLAAGIASAMAFLQFQEFSQGGEILGNVNESRAGARFAGLHKNPNSLGIHALSAIPFAFILYHSSKTAILRIFSLSMLGLCTGALFLSCSRSNLYPLFIYIAAIYTIRRYMKKPSFFENVMIALAIILVGGMFSIAGEYIQNRLLRPIVDYENETSGQARTNILLEGPAIMMKSPLVGVGLHNTIHFSSLTHGSHDTISALLGETGILGTCCFVFFVGMLLSRQVCLVRRSHLHGDVLLQELAIALVGLTCVLAAWIPVKIIFYHRLFWIWAGFVLWLDLRLPRAGVIRAPSSAHHRRPVSFP